MTDLDRLIKLESERHDECNEVEWEKWNEEYQSLYEKLKKAEEYYNLKMLDSGLAFASTDPDGRKYEIERQRVIIKNLEQNQKTPEDIEKIKKYDELVSRINYWVGDIIYDEETPAKVERICKELLDIREQNNGMNYTCENYEKEIQQLKEELELKNRTIQAFDNKLRITELKENQRTVQDVLNAEIVEKIKKRLDGHWYSGQDWNEIDKILKEIK